MLIVTYMQCPYVGRLLLYEKLGINSFLGKVNLKSLQFICDIFSNQTD